MFCVTDEVVSISEIERQRTHTTLDLMQSSLTGGGQPYLKEALSAAVDGIAECLGFDAEGFASAG